MSSLLVFTIKLIALVLKIVLIIITPLTLYLIFFCLVPCWRYIFIITPKTNKIVSEIELRNSINKWRKIIDINPKAIIKSEIRRFNLFNFFRSCSERIDKKRYIVSVGPFGVREATIVHELLHIREGHFEKTEYTNKLIIFLWYNVKFDNEINRHILPKFFEVS